jgi:hypothetical protein
MPDTLYITIADAIARVIGKFPVEALNRLSPLKLTTDRDLIGIERTVYQEIVNLNRDDFEAGRPDNRVLARTITVNRAARVTKAEAERKAARLVADMQQREGKRLRARPIIGWVQPPPPPPQLRRDEVAMALGEMIDKLWQEGRLEMERMAADRSAMLPVPRSTGLQLRLTFPDGEWVIVSRDRLDDPQRIVAPHITEAGLSVLHDAVEAKLTPPAWLKRPTPDEKIGTAAGIAPERWADITLLYEARCWLRTKRPPMDTPKNSADPLEGDRPWARSEGINPKTELPVLRRAYLGQLRRPHQA